MATQEADRPPGKKRRSIFSGKLHTITLILGLIFALVLAFFWIKGINDDQVNKIMTAISTILLLVCAFLTIPFRDPPEESHAASSAPISQVPVPFNQTFNIFPPNAQQPYTSMISTENIADNNVPSWQTTSPNNNPPAQHQPASGNAPALNQQPPPRFNPLPSAAANENEASEVDEGQLLDDLIACRRSGVFSVIANCIQLPPTWHPGDKADPAEQATNLMNWAKHPDGPGIQALNKCYKKALGIETGTGKKK